MFTSGIILLVSDCKRTLGQAPGSAAGGGPRPGATARDGRHERRKPNQGPGTQPDRSVRPHAPRLDPDQDQARPCFLSSRPVAASGEGCRGRPAGGPRPVQQHGHGGRDQGGADGDQGNLPARHAAGDHAGVAGRRGGGNRSACPPGSGCGIIVVRAEAAGMMSADASRPQAAAVRATASRRSLAAACRTMLRGWVSRRERCAVMIVSCLFGDRPACPASVAGSPAEAGAGQRPGYPFRGAGGRRGRSTHRCRGPAAALARIRRVRR